MNRFWKTVLLTGLFVGTTDLFAAYMSQWIKTGKYASGMLRYIAGGALGLDYSMKAGAWVEFLGLFFHYFIAFSFTLFFFWIFPKMKILRFDKWLVGMLYGILASTFISQIVLKLSPLPAKTFVLSDHLVAWFILGVFLGIPIAYSAYRYYGVNESGVRSRE